MSAKDDAFSKIKALLGPEGYKDKPEEMAPYLTSWRNGWVGSAPLIALPNSTAQVSEILTICRKAMIPIVPQGGNTGLVGGSIPSKEGNEIVLCLSRMNKLRKFDATSGTITIEAGMVLENLQETVDEKGFLFPISMGSEGSAEIGGAISTNAGGTAVLRYGNTRDLVRGLEVVLPDGEVLSNLEKLPKDNTGYNLSQYFIGAEGTLGIITAATLKLFPAIRQNITAVFALGHASDALDLLATFRKEVPEYLSAFELMSNEALKLVTKHIQNTRFPGKNDAPFYLLIELGSSSKNIDLRGFFEDLAGKAFEDGKILDAVIAESAAQSKDFWCLRENISEAMRQEGPGIHFDIALPLDQIADFLLSMEPKIKTIESQIIFAPFGHIGDGNIHYNMYFGKTVDAASVPKTKKAIQTSVYAEIRSRGGSISAEHGIGIDRKEELLAYKSQVDMNLMKKIKSALDPDNLLNPGKIFNS